MTEKITEEIKPAAPKTGPTLGTVRSGADVSLNNCSDNPEAPAFTEWPEEKEWADTIKAKLGDTVSDIGLIAKRTLKRLPNRARITAQINKGMQRANNGDDGQPISLQSNKPIVLVLGSGWAAHSLIKVVDTDKYDVVCVSPRNHFVFTPMLPSSAIGTVEFRSLLEPIRISNPFVTYLEAECTEIDVGKKHALCRAQIAYEDGRRPQFEVIYDIMVCAVGEMTATFGVPGVMEHCYFMKEITDTVGLRRRIGESFELAALPGTTEEDRRKALHFCVVGGGPTGVEFAGTLRDFVRGDLSRKYPELMADVKVTLLQSGQTILTSFTDNLQNRALETFRKTGVDVRLGVRVTEVTANKIKLKDGELIDYGICVWSTGNAARPIVQAISAQIPEQKATMEGRNPASTKLAVDPFLRIEGATDAIALGDCSRMAGRPLPATAQVAGQQGAYIARMINRGYVPGRGGLTVPFPCRRADASANGSQNGAAVDEKYYSKPFQFLSLGAMAYLGSDTAVTQLEAGKAVFDLAGYVSFLLWRSVYVTKQVSTRNRVLILFDWVKTRIFGRDLSVF
ncbi:g3596 [Coccomyxa viridis]|uniref:NADH:ubiquinone reductase (non-electrogenic) n=1 Tax=Coccomyxa viridis TaxID=1274662 RepID=A0ABP1FN65_9CHLO